MNLYQECENSIDIYNHNTTMRQSASFHSVLDEQL